MLHERRQASRSVRLASYLCSLLLPPFLSSTAVFDQLHDPMTLRTTLELHLLCRLLHTLLACCLRCCTLATSLQLPHACSAARPAAPLEPPCGPGPAVHAREIVAGQPAPPARARYGGPKARAVINLRSAV